MVEASRTAFVILGNQLFPTKLLKAHETSAFYMGEDRGLCTYVQHHKQKIVMFLAAMRSYRDELEQRGFDVTYRTLDSSLELDADSSYEIQLADFVKRRKIKRLVLWEIEDRDFELRIERFADEQQLELDFLQSPMFVTSRSEMGDWLGSHRPHMANFYQWQRKRLKLLVDDSGDPVGGKWSFDHENRDALPKQVEIPPWRSTPANEHVTALVPLVEKTFSDHPGEVSVADWWLPVTRRQALAAYARFLEARFARFGPYEDALSTRDPFLFHSTMSPSINMGLVTPDELVERALEYAEAHDVPLNSLEGLVRQFVGWREFIRGIYQRSGAEEIKRNHFGHTRRMTAAWYDGSTGMLPLDDVIRKALRYGWTHHIERLMVAANLMTLCEIHPQDAYRWFMELYVDSSEWVMVPNVFGMGIFSDGGIFSTKPYICGSNYIRKMSDFPKPKASALFGEETTWCDALDGLYWRFIDRNRAFFRKQARMATAVSTLDKMKSDRKRHIFSAAEMFLDRVTTS